jgi:GT2 family glycosyltransferase
MTRSDESGRPGAAHLPFVSVIVPVLNGEATIGRCLASLCNDSYPEERREILVVDNGSTDRTPALVHDHPVRLVAEPARGLSQARNRGIEESSGEILVFTDADCYVSKRWLHELTAGFDQDEVAAVTGEVVPYPPSTPAERYSARRKPSVAGWQRDLPSPWFCFMNAAIRRDAFDRVGLFDVRFPGACEDIDFAWRFADAGLRVRRQPRPLVFHQQRMTSLALFRQNLRNGRGWALLHQRYPERAAWGARHELAAWADLGRTGLGAALATARARVGSAAAAEPDYPQLEFLLKLGQRLGFLQGRLKGWIERDTGGEPPLAARRGEG